MSYYEGAGESNPAFATQNPMDGGIIAHDTDNSFQEAVGGFGEYLEAAAGLGAPFRMYSGVGETPRVYSGYGQAPAQAMAGGMTQAAAGVGAPFRVYAGMGSPFRVYAGLGMTADEFNVDEVWGAIQGELSCRAKKGPNCWKYGTTWAYNMKAALAALGFGFFHDTGAPMSWLNEDIRRWKAFCGKVGIIPAANFPSNRAQVQVVKDALVAGKVLGPDKPVNVQVSTSGGQSSIVGTKNESPLEQPGEGTRGAAKAGVWIVGGLAVAAVAALAFFAKKKPAAGAAMTPNKARRRRAKWYVDAKGATCFPPRRR